MNIPSALINNQSNSLSLLHVLIAVKLNEILSHCLGHIDRAQLSINSLNMLLYVSVKLGHSAGL